jgi:hypothetical protein
MINNRIRLPVTIDDLYGGFVVMNGLLRLEKDSLIVEYQTKDNILGGVFKSQPKEARIPLRNLSEVIFKKNWFSASLLLKAYSLTDLAHFPNAEDGMAKFKIKRKHRNDAANLASSLNLRLSEIRLDEMDQEE